MDDYGVNHALTNYLAMGVVLDCHLTHDTIVDCEVTGAGDDH